MNFIGESSILTSAVTGIQLTTCSRRVVNFHEDPVGSKVGAGRSLRPKSSTQLNCAPRLTPRKTHAGRASTRGTITYLLPKASRDYRPRGAPPAPAGAGRRVLPSSGLPTHFVLKVVPGAGQVVGVAGATGSRGRG